MTRPALILDLQLTIQRLEEVWAHGMSGKEVAGVLVAVRDRLMETIRMLEREAVTE